MNVVADERRDPLLEALRQATLGEYDVLGELGRGGMATVYLGHDLALDRKVAIKVLAPGPYTTSALAERFLLEARTAASLTHPHIIPIYTIRRRGDLLYFVMRYVEGAPLDNVIRDRGALPVDAVRTILWQVAGALAYAHRRGVIHRDVKPGNVLLDVDGNAIVTDFGIAKLVQASGLTQPGATVGTPSHMSPEQCRGGEVGGASDQYSLGMVAYEMLTGRTAFASETTLGLIYAHVHEAPPPLAELRGDCPPELAAVVMRMLAKDPASRWPDLESVVAAVGERTGEFAVPTSVAALGREALPGWRPSTPASPIPAARVSASNAPTVATSRNNVTRVSLAPAECRIGVGDVVQLSVAARDERGSTLPGRSVLWQTSAPAVATVSHAGIVTGVGPGEASITVMSDGKVAAAAITVTAEIMVAEGQVDVCPSGGTMVVGQAVRLGLVTRNSGDPVVEHEVVWTSSEPGVARITVDGDLLAEGTGVTVVTGTVRGISASARFTVTRVEVTRLAIQAAGGNLFVGEDMELSVVAYDRLGSRLAGRLVQWSSSQPAIAAVDQGGTVRALASGVTEIVAACGDAREARALRVLPAVVTGVDISPRALVLSPGETGRLSAVAISANGRPLPGLEAAWATSDEKVVAIAADGLVSARREGSVRVAATIAGRRSTVRVEVRRRTAP